MKLSRFILTIFVLAAIHPPNENIFCARPGCGHRHFSHAKGNGPCEYVDLFTPAGHCPGFLRK